MLVHRLVQAITRDQLPPGEAVQWQQAAAALVGAAIPADATVPTAWPACALLLPHAQAVLDLTSDGMSQIAMYLGQGGNDPAARDLFRLIADAHSSDAYGPDHPGTLSARSTSSPAGPGMPGMPPGPVTSSPPCCPTTSESWAPTTPDPVRPRHPCRVGRECGGCDGPAISTPCCCPSRQILGADHPDTLSTRHDLAHFTGEAGDAAGARDRFAALLPVRERFRSRPPRPPGPRHDSRVGPGRR